LISKVGFVDGNFVNGISTDGNSVSRISTRGIFAGRNWALQLKKPLESG